MVSCDMCVQLLFDTYLAAPIGSGLCGKGSVKLNLKLDILKVIKGLDLLIPCAASPFLPSLVVKPIFVICWMLTL
jgi:hypothetical protein